MRAAGRGGWPLLGDVISLSFEAGMTAVGGCSADVPPIEADIDEEEAGDAHEAEDEAEDEGDWRIWMRCALVGDRRRAMVADMAAICKGLLVCGEGGVLRVFSGMSCWMAGRSMAAMVINSP